MFHFTEDEFYECRKMAVAGIAAKIGAWDFTLKSQEELRDLIKSSNPALLASIDDYYERLWECECASPEKVAGLIPARDAARAKMLAELARA